MKSPAPRLGLDDLLAAPRARLAGPMAEGVAAELQEQLALTRRIRGALASSSWTGLQPLISGVTRGSPVRGVRGSELVIWAVHAPAASRLKLCEADLLRLAQGLGAGIQTVKVRVLAASGSGDGRSTPVGPAMAARPARSGTIEEAIRALRQRRAT